MTAIAGASASQRPAPFKHWRRSHGVRPAGSHPGPTDPGLNGRQVLVAFLAFFGAIFLMNGVLIYWAIATNSGLVANEPYRKGLEYNKRIAADERQRQLAWSDKLTLTKDGQVALVVADKTGQPVSGLKVETVLGRPATNREDIRTALVEVAPGRYEAHVAALGAGFWLIALEARRDSEASLYRIRRRVWLTP
jgi:nitrogen fixation protein FixH